MKIKTFLYFALILFSTIIPIIVIISFNKSNYKPTTPAFKLKKTNKNISNKTLENHFAILPHFMLWKSKVDEFYKFLISKYNLSWKKLNILIISPNHFWVGQNQFISFSNWNLCFKNDCIYVNSLTDNKLIFNWYWNLKYSTKDDLEYKIWNNLYTSEHWIGVHFQFIKKYFPWSKIYWLVVNPHNFKNVDKLISFLKQKFKSNTLFLASVDFSHYNLENFAYLHDRHTLYVLYNSYKKQDYKTIETDCPVCLYIINKLALYQSQYPHLRYRDSSTTITKISQNFNNTSRMFYFFTKNKPNINWLTIIFFWDTIYDRWIKYYFPTKKKFFKFLKQFLTQADINKNPKIYKHRKLFWIDFAWFNLETPVVKNKSICKKSYKTIQFCSEKTFLTWLSQIWFNIVNITNNHSLDWWLNAFLDTINNLSSNKFNYFWWIKYGNYYEKNFVYTGLIRWIKFAWHWYDFTITKIKFDKICKDLQKYKENWYLNFVITHWWIEYKTHHSQYQETIWKKLIDCWADLIIWTHPHVIQDIDYYKWKPIIYSLWNFIFDQFKIEGWNIGWYITIDISSTWKINRLNLWKFKITSNQINFIIK